MGRGSWLMGRGSWVVDCGLWVVGRGPWAMGCGTWVVVLLTGRFSKPISGPTQSIRPPSAQHDPSI